MSQFDRHQFQDIHDVVALVTSAVDPASLVDGAGETKTVTVTGAALGDFVDVAPGINTQGMLIWGWVSAANTVSIRIQNETGGALNIASSTWNILVRRPAASAKRAAS